MDIDTYKRILAVNGNNIAQANTNATINNINGKFADSPFYANIPINGVNIDVRIMQSDDSDPDIKTLLFKPNTTVNRGSIATIGSYKWMMMDFFDNAIFPKSTINRCSDVLKWKTKNGTIVQYDCVNSLLSQREINLKNDRILDIPVGKIIVNTPYNNDTTTVQLKQRFLFGKTAYIVIGKDDISNVYGNQGYITFALEPTESNSSDNFTTQIADNSVLYGNSSSGNTSTYGGGLW